MKVADVCVTTCAYGVCTKSMNDPYGCGGCCACLGPCVVAWEDDQSLRANPTADDGDTIIRSTN